MSAKRQLRLLVALLLVLGLGLTAYKIWGLGFPISPDERASVWTVQAQVEARATGDPVRVQLNLPDMTEELYVVDQGSSPRGFGFHVERIREQRFGVWEARAPRGKVNLFYQARVYKGGGIPYEYPAPETAPDAPGFTDVEADAADEVLERAYQYSADPVGLGLRLATEFFAEENAPLISTLIGQDPSEMDRINAVLRLMHAAEAPAHLVRGLLLGKDSRDAALTTLIEVWDGKAWKVIDPVKLDVGMPEQFLTWQRGDEFLFQVDGARDSALSFAVIQDSVSSRSLAVQSGKQSGNPLVNFSVFALPVDVQNTFAALLLIPIGALVVVVLRNLVGLQTSGTFMPILIAMVFVQTQLLTGLILFISVVGFGLIIRGYLTSLNLLLVPRIAAVLIVVITLYLGMSIIGYRLGIEAALSVTFFPMIIIAWTIERMSVLAEEEGMRDVIVQGGGSLITAVIAFLLMTNNQIAYMTFAFPELLLVVLAIILMIGQYTGYRLSELRRFEPLAGDGS